MGNNRTICPLWVTLMPMILTAYKIAVVKKEQSNGSDQWADEQIKTLEAELMHIAEALDRFMLQQQKNKQSTQ
jgi:hypothetical protein